VEVSQAFRNVTIFSGYATRQKNITISSGAMKSDYLDEVLGGSGLEIHLRTEMAPCRSCAGIIQEYRNTTGGLQLSEGTKYYNPPAFN
jgi:hypothetical protein